jgi:hypothetical protein
MSKKILTLKDKKEFIKNFLYPISKISESAILDISKDTLSSTIATANNSVILNITNSIFTDGLLEDVQEVISLNCPDIKKLIKAVELAKDGDLSFFIENNNLKYENKEIRFKYHLLDDGIIKKPKLVLSKVNDMEFNSSFFIGRNDIRELLKCSIFSVDSNKAYISSEEGCVFAELTDKTRNNIDTITVKLSDEMKGDDISNFALDFEIFRIIDSPNVKDILIKINTKIGVAMFEINNNYNKMIYIMSSLIK